jgi:hypothetical protein
MPAARDSDKSSPLFGTTVFAIWLKQEAYAGHVSAAQSVRTEVAAKLIRDQLRKVLETQRNRSRSS